MKISLPVLFSLTLVLGLSILVSGCGNQFANDMSSIHPTLPKSWYQLPENGGPQKSSERRSRPTEEMSQAVRTAFSVHTEALAELEDVPTVELDSSFALVVRPSDYTPWHLDGMIANFAVSGGGLFGPLMLDGEASVKAIWQKVSKQKNAGPGLAKKPKAFKFRANMTDKEIAKMLEPAVRSAVATKAVRNERAFRHNLNQQGKSFAKMARLMNRLPSRRDWHVQRYELKLAFSAEGQVSATMGVGGSLTVYFKWEEEVKNSLIFDSEPLIGFDEVLYGNLVAFTRTMASLIPEALQDAREILRAGFELEEFLVGVGVSVGGDIGVASVEGSVDGRLVFVRGEHSFLEGGVDTESKQDIGNNFVTMVTSQVPSQTHIAYAKQVGTSAESLTNGGMIYRIARSRFRAGMKEALTMGSYFVDEGRKEDTASWKLSEIETEFQVSIGGDVSVVTVDGHGNFALTFKRVGL
jgi:hypothetical protein